MTAHLPGTTIVVGVDGSDESRRAALVARGLAERLGRRLLLVHAMQVPVPAGASFALPVGSAPGDEERRLQGARGLLELEAARLGDGEFDLHARLGPPEESLLDVADEHDATLLVVGSRGRGRISALLLGSVSSSLAARARCPVVVVPATAEGAVPGEPAGAVACGVDGSPGSDRAAGAAAALAEALGLRLSLLHAVGRQTLPGVGAAPGARERLEAMEADEGLELVDHLLARLSVPPAASRRVAVGSAASVLARLAADERAQLLVVGSRGRGPAAALLVGSVTQELAASAPCPVVVVPPEMTEWPAPAT